MKKSHQRKEHKSNHKVEVVGGQELLVRVPLPMAEVWAEMQAQVEELAARLGVPNIESRCNQLKLGHPLVVSMAGAAYDAQVERLNRKSRSGGVH